MTVEINKVPVAADATTLLLAAPRGRANLPGLVTPSSLTPFLGLREVATYNRVYYVRTNGSDSNDGLTDTPSGAFLTLQKAWDTLKGVDIGGNSAFIQVADGTYAAGIIGNGPILNAANVYIWGNLTTPANVIINASAQSFLFQANAIVNIDGFTVKSSTAEGILIRRGAQATIGKVIYGLCATDHNLCDGGYILFTAPYTINGSATTGSHHHVYGYGDIAADNVAVTLTGTPAFGGYYAGVANGSVTYSGASFSGAATGRRYYVQYCGVLRLSGLTLPGSIAGINEGGNQDDQTTGIGTKTNDDAQPTNIGEYVSSSVAVGSATALTTVTAKTVTSISLTPGDWDISAMIGYTGAGTTTVSSLIGSISLVNNVMDATPGQQACRVGTGNTEFSVNDPSMTIGPYRASIAATTTVYLIALVSFGTSTCSAYGKISARRAR